MTTTTPRPASAGRAVLLFLFAGVATAAAIVYAERGSPGPRARIAGPQQVVFRWSRDACEPNDIPDLPVRAFRDASGRVNLTLSHFGSRRLTGRSLRRLSHPCGVALRSHRSADPSRFDDREWIAATYTRDGRDVIALVHDEYQGHRHPGRCPSGRYRRCWYNAVTLARSGDWGRTFEHAPPPAHLVAAPLRRYRPDGGPQGVLGPSNIVFRRADRHFYVLVHVRRSLGQREGVCLLRTGTPARAGSWRAWNGEGFSVRMETPYRPGAAPPGERACAPVSPGDIGLMSQSLTYNTYFHRFLLIGRADSPSPGFYFALSDDLVHWTRRRLLMRAESRESFRCGDRHPLAYPSLIDPRSRSRNFATSGRRAQLYFTRFNYRRCRATLDRDLVRVPVEFSR